MKQTSNLVSILQSYRKILQISVALYVSFFALRLVISERLLTIVEAAFNEALLVSQCPQGSLFEAMRRKTMFNSGRYVLRINH